MSNGYKVSGAKMTSRFGMSRRESREAIKHGYMPSEAEVKCYGRDPSMPRRVWQKRQRWSQRQLRTHYKGLPERDMDGSVFREIW